MNPFYSLPDIITETSEGIGHHSLQDELFKDRQIELLGDITPELVHTIMLQLRCLQKQDPEKEITFFINSPGGRVSSGLALYDLMEAV